MLHLHETYDLAASGYLAPQDSKDLVADALALTAQIQVQLKLTKSGDYQILRDIDEVKSKLKKFEISFVRPCPKGIPASEVETYQRIFKTLVAMSKSPGQTMELIEAVLQQRWQCPDMDGLCTRKLQD